MRMPIMRIIGWIAEFFPHAVFYSSKFMKDEFTPYPEGECEGVHQRKSAIAMVGVCVAASRILTHEGMKVESEFTAVTNKGRDVGSYKITIERVA